MMLAFDTWYTDEQAKTACICFHDWQDPKPAQVLTEVRAPGAAYEPGAFYKRELPCILSLLTQFSLPEVSAIVVDGFVVLDDAGKPGLGQHLYDHLSGKIPVIGVAKNKYADLDQAQRKLYRGQSQKPLYITAAGIDLDLATHYISLMKGPFRIPDLLKHLDQLSRQP
ncbi:MAG: endonuclease V [Bacteroidia bacterium]|jgi:exodeoxyribonuclease-5/deoxyribonuclease V|nr:endonuclease V [Bacteroidia bacterium]